MLSKNPHIVEKVKNNLSLKKQNHIHLQNKYLWQGGSGGTGWVGVYLWGGERLFEKNVRSYKNQDNNKE